MVGRSLQFRSKIRDRSHLLPLVVIGSLRAGGAGKTAVTIELARWMVSLGYRVGVLAYRIGESGNAEMTEVTAESDWHCCSDEAILLARESRARVFVTRNREQAWDLLSRKGEFDALISDDGLMDSRLEAAFRIALRRPDERPGIFDLLPAGPYRLTARILTQVDCIVEGPLSTGEPKGFWFHRELVFPDGFDPRQPCWAICGLGNPQAFRRDLLTAGVNLVGMTCGPNHGLPNLNVARTQAIRGNATGFVCTAKDGIKLVAMAEKPGALTVIGERIELSPDLISIVEKHLRFRSSSQPATS